MVHARFYSFATRWRTFFVRSIRSSSVYFTVLTRHNTSLYLLLIRLLYGLIRYTSVFLRSLSVNHPLRFVKFCQIWHHTYERVRTYEVIFSRYSSVSAYSLMCDRGITIPLRAAETIK